jgi:Sec-independent protein translocase protein TatA
MNLQRMIALSLLLFVLSILQCEAFNLRTLKHFGNTHQKEPLKSPLTINYGQSLINKRTVPLHDILGLGPAEIAITLVAALVLFGPETLKSLTKDVGKAAAELKDLPKTFKEGMEEGSSSSQVTKMKAIAAEKRAKRDAALGDRGETSDDEDVDSAAP